MLTGVIYGAIVVAWAAYLVPLALRRHDEVSKTRSIERFSSAMRVLSRRGTAPAGAAAARPGPKADEREVVSPPRSGSRLVTPDPDPEPQRVMVAPQRNHAAERAAAARRRQVLTALVTVTVVVAISGAMGAVSQLAFLIPLCVVVAFLVVARLSVRRATRPQWVEMAADEAPASASVVVRQPAAPAARVEASLDDAGAAPQPEREPEPVDDEPTVTLPAVKAPVAAAAASGGRSLWDPVPVTLPTYVTAAAAPRTVRTIPLGETAATQRPVPGPAGTVRPAEVDDVPRVVNG